MKDDGVYLKHVLRCIARIARHGGEGGVGPRWQPDCVRRNPCGGATRTIGFYAHYDGQPLDPREWTTPPFEPTLRDRRVEDGGRVISRPPAGTQFDPEWRLYARGAADDKAPIVALMTAIDAVRAAGIAFKANIKFAFEDEEEAGSPNLERTLAANKDLFAADLWLMCDAPPVPNTAAVCHLRCES